MSGKPKYSVPSMSEVLNIPENGLNVVSTFSGCGGSSLGYRMAGFKVLAALEFVDAAVETYKANFPTTTVITKDIRDVSPKDILKEIGLEPGELDVLDGSPPCASFSMAGKRQNGWGKVKNYSDTVQRSDDLFFEFIRLIEGLSPKVFVAENVEGLLRGKAKGYFKRIIEMMRSAGYSVKCGLLDASYYGVPQSRKRAIFIGVRNDLGLAPLFPTPFSYRYSIADAISWLGDTEYKADEASSMIGYATGREWYNVPVGGASKKYFQLVRPPTFRSGNEYLRRRREAEGGPPR